MVDDDHALAEMIGIVLAGQDFELSYCNHGSKALEVFEQERPDLVLLDVMLPGLDGVAICEQIRKVSGVPVIMLTAKSDTTDVVRGLEAGADDYVVKPFNPTELIARVKARLRDTTPESTDALTVGDLIVDVSARQVFRGEVELALTPLEFELLHTLAREPQRAFSREELLESVWGYQYKADTRLVNVHVQRLRAKVELDPENPVIVCTVRGFGYRAASAEPSAEPSSGLSAEPSDA